MHNIPDNPYRVAAPGDLQHDLASDSDLRARIEQLEQDNERLTAELEQAQGDKADLLFTLRRMRQIGKAMESECSDVLRECGETLEDEDE
jgi:hypothetical protein